MKKLNNLIVLAMVAIIFAACSKDSHDVLPNDDRGSMKASTTQGENFVDLMAGQHILVGKVAFNEVDTDGDGTLDAMEVCYVIENNDWQIMEIHFAIGSSLSDIPRNNAGNPMIGHFPYHFHPAGVSSYCFTIPFSEAFDCGGNYIAAAHAVVKRTSGNKTETAWGKGTRFVPKGNWAMYFGVSVECIPPDIS